jgi:hypothetical protein
MKLLPVITVCALLGVIATANANPYVVTLEEVGSNVVATGGGQIDLTGLMFRGFGGSTGPVINPGFAGSQFVIGATGSFDVYFRFTGPNFGTGSATPASTGTGDLVGFVLNVGQLYVPAGYVSGNPLTDSATYDNATFASLSVIPGVYKYSWGSGADQRITLEIGQTPLPAALPLFATGLGAMGLFGWLKKRKVKMVSA